jgi:hypothetical protein
MRVPTEDAENPRLKSDRAHQGFGGSGQAKLHGVMERGNGHWRVVQEHDRRLAIATGQHLLEVGQPLTADIAEPAGIAGGVKRTPRPAQGATLKPERAR